MYDLLILGMLMARDYSGYKLGHILGKVLVPRRKLSNGVIYPLLERLEREGYITATEQEVGGRRTKMMHITDAGKERFYELMAQPVANDAKRADIYRFKFRGFDHINHAQQMQILDEYMQSVQDDLDNYVHAKAKLQEEAKSFPNQAGHYRWSVNAIDLQIKMSQDQLAWAQQMQSEIQMEEKKE